MAQRESAHLPILQSAPNDLRKGKFVANAKPASLRSQDWFDNLDKIDMVAFHPTVSGRATIRRREGSPIMHVNGFVRGKGKFIVTEYIATEEKTRPRFPLLLTAGHILSQYNVGAQTRRTANSLWHKEDLLEIHPRDVEQRGVRDGDWVRLASRSGKTTPHRSGGARRGLHHVLLPRDGGERHHHDQLPGIQCHLRAGPAVERSVALAGGL
jgi:anaerobic selenocysteine-containing dehydrogenase